MLGYALERFVEGDVGAEESLRAIGTDLPSAILQTINAAMAEFDPENVTSLLNAAVFGRTFLGTLMSSGVSPDQFLQNASAAVSGGGNGAGAEEQLPPSEDEEENLTAAGLAARFVDACMWIRISQQLRDQSDCPVTVAQAKAAGLRIVLEWLLEKRQHLLAKRICDWLALPTHRVLVAWSRDKILNSPALTDAQLFKMIVRRFEAEEGSTGNAGPSVVPSSSRPSYRLRVRHFGKQRGAVEEHVPVRRPNRTSPFADVADIAASGHRPGLATLLLQHETDAAHQIAMFLRLQEFQLALEAATVPRGDPELVRVCLNDPELPVELVMQNSRARNVHVRKLKRLQKYKELQAFAESLGHKKLAAEAHLLQAYQSCLGLPEQLEHLQKCSSLFGVQTILTNVVVVRSTVSGRTGGATADGASGPSTNKEGAAASGGDAGEASSSTQQTTTQTIAALPFAAAVTSEHLNLLKAQEKLEAKNLGALNSLAGPHRASVLQSVGAKRNQPSEPPLYNFIGRSATGTVRVLVLLGQYAEADKLRKDFQIPERRFWNAKISALVEARSVEELKEATKVGRFTVGEGGRRIISVPHEK